MEGIRSNPLQAVQMLQEEKTYFPKEPLGCLSLVSGQAFIFPFLLWPPGIHVTKSPLVETVTGTHGPRCLLPSLFGECVLRAFVVRILRMGRKTSDR